jgi:molybdate transport system substrate-binding protein
VRVSRFAVAVALILGANCGCDARSDDSQWKESQRVVVYAAASLAGVLEAVLNARGSAGFEFEGPRPRFVFAASSTLARQLEHGAPPGIFLSASRDWMLHLEARGRLATGSRRELFRNRLVLVRPFRKTNLTAAASGPSVSEVGALELRELILSRASARLCLGDPEHVPAGMYARQALEKSGLWDSVSSRVLPGADARRTIWYLSRGACALGVVYQTDAYSGESVPEVEPLALLNENLHAPIVYEVALVQGAPPAARNLYDFLYSPGARRIFQSFGFVARP